jgi:hypothetical protein
VGKRGGLSVEEPADREEEGEGEARQRDARRGVVLHHELVAEAGAGGEFEGLLADPDERDHFEEYDRGLAGP